MGQMADVEKILFQRLNTESIFDISIASGKLSALSHGKIFSYIDSTFSFFCAAWMSLARMVSNFILMLLSSPFAIFSEDSRNFFMSHLCRSGIDLGCAITGAVGMLSPHVGRLITGIFNAFLSQLADGKSDHSGQTEGAIIFAAPMVCLVLNIEEVHDDLKPRTK